MSTAREIGVWALIFAMVYGLRAAMGPELWEFFVGPYAKLGLMIWDRLPPCNHPILLVIYAVAILTPAAGWVRHVRAVAVPSLPCSSFGRASPSLERPACRRACGWGPLRCWRSAGCCSARRLAIRGCGRGSGAAEANRTPRRPYEND